MPSKWLCIFNLQSPQESRPGLFGRLKSEISLQIKQSVGACLGFLPYLEDNHKLDSQSWKPDQLAKRCQQELIKLNEGALH